MGWNAYILFWICVIGLCLGSFYNVVILRSLSGESIVFPPSKCPKCGHSLYFWHNIPIFSYLLLKGKCYFCKSKISIQYPLVELLTMILFGLTFIKFGATIKTLFVLIWLSAFIIMTMTDIKAKLVDCNIAIGVGVLGIIYNFIFFGWNGVISSVASIALCVIILELIARIGYIFAKTRAMGEADTYVAGALGAIFGLNGTVNVLLYSFITAMIIAVPMFFYKKYRNGDKLSCLIALLFAAAVIIHLLYVQNIFTILSLVILGCILSYNTLKNIKSSEKLTYFPFVPAFFIGTIIAFGMQF